MAREADEGLEEHLGLEYSRLGDAIGVMHTDELDLAYSRVGWVLIRGTNGLCNLGR